jgi:hypothetical protein
MSFAPVYLLNRLFFRVSDFFHHWYVDGSRSILHRFVSFFETLDRSFALRITLRYFWKPLYGDYSIVGHIFGFFFRLGRLVIGGVVYLLCAAVMLTIYLAWLVLPFAILFSIYRAYITQTP